MKDPHRQITRILQSQELQTSDELLPLVYEDLRRIARARLAHDVPGQTLQPTALVHEAYMRVAGDGDLSWDSRRHFFSAAAEAMRRILIDKARRRQSPKHGGDLKRMDVGDGLLEEELQAIESPVEDVLAVEEALASLEAADPRAREIVNLRYFAGFTAEQTAEALGTSLRTIEREWAFVRTFLQARLGAQVDEWGS